MGSGGVCPRGDDARGGGGAGPSMNTFVNGRH